MNENSLHVGDAAAVLGDFEDGSLHTVVTSPPYFQQRDYDTDGQLGREETVEAYLDNLVSVFSECYRVLRDDGSLLVNIGDAYVNKERQLIPFRLAERLREDVGFLLRQDLVWEKTHGKPDPANDRRANNHEYIFHCTKQRDYWYDESVRDGGHTSVIEAPTATSDLDHVAVYSEEFVEACLTGVTPPEVCGECGCPYKRQFEEVPRPFADPDRTQSRRARQKFEDSGLTDDHIDAIQAVGISDVGKAAETEDGAGRNADDVTALAREAKDVLGGYYREFTMVERIPEGFQQTCDCNTSSVGGVVCDPFVGSGTTAVVADCLGYRYVGVDVNGEYVEMARQRVGGAV